jgi:nucleoside 2-deoxyribosyltransferase
MRAYLAHPISTRGEFTDSIRVANRIRSLGFEVFAAAESKSINDKSNNPTPIDIYDVDMGALLSSDIVVVNLTGGHADGTITELGAVAGWNEALSEPGVQTDGVYEIKIVAYTSNARLLQPQFHKGIPSASANHLSLGTVEKWGSFVGGEAEMLTELERLR